MSESLVFKSIRQLGGLIQAREVSPTELAEVFLDRLERLGGDYNAVVTVTRERALREARRAEQEISSGRYRGPLHGIPYGVKDLLATKDGIPTTWGAAPFRNQVFDYDATVVERLGAAGAVLAAKLAMVELAGGGGYWQPNASFTGPGITPWDKNRWSGGSSTGSGAATGAGLVPFAIGSETGGSIMSPSSNCGVAGLRPTYGRVSRYGAMALSWTLDKLGPMCLTADDCGLVLEAISGRDPKDPTTTRRSFSYDDSDVGSRRFRFGVMENVTDHVDEPTRTNFERALDALGTVADIEEMRFSDLPHEEILQVILFAEAASAFEEIVDSGKLAELTAPEDRFGAYPRVTVLAKDYINALRLRRLVAENAEEAMSPFDALVAPTRSGVATPVNQGFRSATLHAGKDTMMSLGNVAGLPAVSVPSGFSEEGLPTGIKFMGRAYEENAILAAARAYQSLTEWHERHPPDLLPAG
ncbi:MAG: amidase [bacterium]|nr:amidase [bacterium]